MNLLLFNLSAQNTLDFQRFTQKNGLSSNYILSVYQDHKGFIWIGTESGLDRFDGQHFLHFKNDPEDSETLDDNWVQILYEDSQNNLWIGTEKGLNRLNRTTGKIERIPIYKSGQKIQGVPQGLSEDQSGNLWMTIGEEGLFQLKKTKEQERNWELEYLVLEDSLEDVMDEWKRNRLLLATTEELWLSGKNAIKRFHLPSQKLTYFFPSKSGESKGPKENIINSMYLGEGKIVGYTPSNLFVLDTRPDNPVIQSLQSIKLQTIESRQNFIHLKFLKMREDALLISVYRDLFFLNTQTGQVEWVPPQVQSAMQSFPDLIRSPFKDREGNIWIGTEGSGLYMGQPGEKPFIFYQNDPSDPNSLSAGQVRSFTEDDRGQLWVGILNQGIDQFVYNKDRILQKKRTITPLGNPSVPPIDRMVKIIVGPDQSLWIASLTQGVIKMDSTTKRFTIFDHQPNDTSSLSSNRAWGLSKSLDGYIWAGTWWDGLNRIDPVSGSIKKFRHDPSNSNSLISDEIRYLYTDPQGILWIGTNNGLSSFDSKSNQFTNYQHDPNDPKSLSDNLVWAIHVDREGALWVGTNTGLNRYNKENDQFEHFFEKNGLPNNTIYGILEDDEGTLWVSTENGLARRLPKGTNSAFFPIGLADGLQTASFVPKAYLNSSQSEQMYFGSTDGILVVKPSLLQLKKPQPQFALHSLSKFNPAKNQGESLVDYFVNDRQNFIKLFHKDQSIRISLSDLNWKENKGLRYDYQLEGFNSQWMPLEEDMQLRFTNLSPGNYQLQVRARNAENISSEITTLLRLRVYPPWWRSAWAYILYVLIIGGILFAINRFQLRRQFEKQEAQNLRTLDAFKNKLYTNITHEFRTPLTIISGMVDQIEKNPTQWVKRGTKMIRKNNATLLDLINQMLELQKVESGNLEAKMQLGDIIPFLRNIFDQFQAFSQSKEQQLKFTAEPDSIKMDFDAEKILRIVSNLLSNAIKYTPEKGEIIFEVSKDTKANNCLVLTVKDTGPGIPKAQLPYIFNRFYQANIPGSGSGTGIGLSLTQELVKLLNGTIEVSSMEGQGSTFQVLLPITQLAAPGISHDKRLIQSAVLGAQNLSKKPRPKLTELPIALIVEDNYDIAQYLQVCLDGSYQLELTSNGQVGIDKALELVPDIIISDVMMPVKDGFELCETLKEDIRTSHIPIILLTAKSDVESRILGLKRGADDYLGKPFNEEELKVRMQNLLEIRRKLQIRYQNFYEQPLPKVKLANPDIEDAFILKIKELFEAHIMDPGFDPKFLGQELNLSKSNLYRKMKALTGRTPAIYIRLLRLQKARQLLLSSDLPIKQVAYDVGFSDPAYFTKSYTAEFGENPSETRL